MAILKYPKHFYDPIRREIAAEQMQHDVRKLFPEIKEGDWPQIDKNIEEWFSGEKFELEPAHDFWNFFSGFARGLKGKSLTSWITAENVVWSKEDVEVAQIVITWDFPGLDFMGKAPYRAHDVIERLKKPDMVIEKEKLIKDSDQRSKKFVPRDQFRVILFDDAKGDIINTMPGFYILEGNRRTVRAITHDLETIPAYVGRFKNEDDQWPENYWIPTGMLRDLIFMAIRYDKEKDKKAFDVIRKFYQLLLRDFDIARIATIDKAFKNYETSRKLISDLIMEDLK